MKLNIGSGGKPFDGFVNVDVQEMENPDVVCDLEHDIWPFEDNSVDEVRAFHILEHIGNGFFHFIKELYRVCKDGAKIHIIVPHPRHDVFLNDPTHKRPVTHDLMALFSKRLHYANLEEGRQYTPFWKYNNVDFDLCSNIQMVLDPYIDPDSNWKERERHENNIIVEIRFDMVVIKNA